MIRDMKQTAHHLGEEMPQVTDRDIMKLLTRVAAALEETSGLAVNIWKWDATPIVARTT